MFNLQPPLKKKNPPLLVLAALPLLISHTVESLSPNRAGKTFLQDKFHPT